MSVGAHLRLASWWELQPDPSEELKYVTVALASGGHACYEEPTEAPDVYTVVDAMRCFGCSALDTSSANSLAALGAIAKTVAAPVPMLGILYTYPVYLLPVDFREPIVLSHPPFTRYLASSHEMLRNLRSIAPQLGLNLQGGLLSQDTVRSINAGDEDERACDWLFLYDAARLGVAHGCAVVLA